jgi:hypothetical protein
MITDYRTERLRQKFIVPDHLRTLAGLSRISEEAADFFALLHSAGFFSFQYMFVHHKVLIQSQFLQ